MQFTVLQLCDVFSLGYVGPGAGLTAIGALVAILAAVVLLVVGFVWYPLRRLRRAMKKKNEISPESPDAEVQHQPVATDDGGKDG